MKWSHHKIGKAVCADLSVTSNMSLQQFIISLAYGPPCVWLAASLLCMGSDSLPNMFFCTFELQSLQLHFYWIYWFYLKVLSLFLHVCVLLFCGFLLLKSEKKMLRSVCLTFCCLLLFLGIRCHCCERFQISFGEPFLHIPKHSDKIHN